MFEPNDYYMSRLSLGVGRQDNEKKTPYIYIEGEITHVAENGGWTELRKPETRTIKLYMSEKAAPHSIKKLDALGFNGDFKNPLLSEESMNGIAVECDHEANNGKTYEKWQLPGGSMKHEAVSGDEIRRLNALYRQNKAATQPRQSPPKKNAAPEPVESPESEPVAAADIPF
jgi:hypothetical protein